MGRFPYPSHPTHLPARWYLHKAVVQFPHIQLHLIVNGEQRGSWRHHFLFQTDIKIMILGQANIATKKRLLCTLWYQGRQEDIDI